MFLAVTRTHPTAGLLHQLGLMIEMRPHELLQPRQEKCKLNRLTIDRLKPPTRDRQMVGINHLMPRDMLPSGWRTRAPNRRSSSRQRLHAKTGCDFFSTEATFI